MTKLFYSIITVVLMLVGCSNDSSTSERQETKGNVNKEELSYKDTQGEIVDFINNDIQKIVTYETEANQQLATVSGDNYNSDEELYEVLTSKVIPTYEKAVNEAKELQVSAEELEPMKSKIKEATSTYYEALILEKEALEKKDKGLIEESNKKGQEYIVLINSYHEDMKNLASKYEIDYQPN
ncbi:hypothetical protein NSQ89_00940 [Niallia sp. FSL R7-0648]|uniref:hypothetical protein n=1 Tax=Niallia sp. FSL R7-0648 TaxID=2954521 RepID=UPI0030F96359